MSRVTEEPIYKKSELLMSIQRGILRNRFTRPIAKYLDKTFHNQSGEWDPWYRKFSGKSESYRILYKPDNESVYNVVKQYPDKLMGWVFINPSDSLWEDEIDKWLPKEGMIGVKVHPFWHRYSVSELMPVLEKIQNKRIPLLIHLGFDELSGLRKLCANNKIPIIFSHAGFPFYKDLWEIAERNENIYFDLSSHHVDKGIVKKVVGKVGASRCMFATDDPYGESDFGSSLINWINSINLTENEKEMIFYKNISSI